MAEVEELDEVPGDYDLILEDYQDFVNGLLGSSDLAMPALGLAGEAGEVVELIKKHLYHGKPLDKTELLSELGDVVWYVAAMAHNAGLDIADVLAFNVIKLSQRYPDGFVKGGGNR